MTRYDDPMLEAERAEARVHPESLHSGALAGVRRALTSRKGGGKKTSETAWFVVFLSALAMGLALWFWPEADARQDNQAALRYILREGLPVTLKLIGASLGGALVLGLCAGLARTSHFVPLRLLGTVYVESIRGIPIIVLLFFFYYGINALLPMDHKLEPFWAAFVCFSVAYGAFIGEVIRAGIEAIPPEELEAASLDAAWWPRFFYVIAPRAFRTILPAVGNECIALLKDTAVVTVIALVDLTRATVEYASQTFNYFNAYLVLAWIYLFLTLLLSRVVRFLERWLGD